MKNIKKYIPLPDDFIFNEVVYLLSGGKFVRLGMTLDEIISYAEDNYIGDYEIVDIEFFNNVRMNVSHINIRLQENNENL